MSKALISIGVGSTDGHFPKLKGAAADTRAVDKWGKAQGFDCILLADLRKKVRVADVFLAIKNVVNKGTYSQIIVYFSGHGVLLAPNSEAWLLSDAPENPSEAINVSGSIMNARGCGIDHVVFISDACRSLPESLTTASLTPGAIFPARRTPPPRAKIDIFYATLPGDVAYEEAASASLQRKRGILTQCLLRALEGDVPDVIHHYPQPGGASSRVVPCGPLSDYLVLAVPEAAEKISIKLTQNPDSIIESNLPKFLGRIIEKPTPMKIRPSSGGRVAYDLSMPEEAGRHADRPRSISKSRDRQMLTPSVWPNRVGVALAGSTDAQRALMEKIIRPAPAAPVPFMTGFVVKGGLVGKATSSAGRASIHNEMQTSWVGIELPKSKHQLHGNPSGQTAVLRFTDGSGIALAVLPGYVGELTIEDGRVLTVNYTPAEGSRNYDEYLAVAPGLDERRALAALAAKSGSFRPWQGKEARIADHLRLLKRADPTLGIYAAYGYAQIGDMESVQSVYDYMRHEPESVPFDIAMLAEQEGDGPLPDLAPGMPMLTQGWLLLGRFEVLLPQPLRKAREFIKPSFWATFMSEGVDILEEYFSKG